MASTDGSERPTPLKSLRIGSPTNSLRNPQLNLLTSGAAQRRSDRSGPLSPVLSDSNSWGIGPSLTRTISANSTASGPIDRSIWQNEPQTRLSRVSEIKAGTESIHSAAGRSGNAAETSIPFHIPLNPNPKSYRSQSYSVGQLETASNPGASSRFSFTRGNYNTRSRPGRSGILGEHEAFSLHHVREDEDTSEWMYDQMTQSPQINYPSFDPRSHSSAVKSFGQNGERPSSKAENSPARKESSSYFVPEDVVDDVEDGSISAGQPGRNDWPGPSHTLRPNQLVSQAMTSPLSPVFRESQDLLAKKAQWQSDYDAATIPDLPQSRRHSFATVPSRGLAVRYQESPTTDLRLSRKEHNLRAAESNDNRFGSSTGQLLHTGDKRDELMHRQVPHSTNPRPFLPQMYESSAHQSTRLYLVTFKLGRAEFYYAPEALGLEISRGNTVIVDADRGTDLGTVMEDDVHLEDVPALKGHWEREHFNCLMMFSRRFNNDKHVDANNLEHGTRTAGQVNTAITPVNAHGRADGGIADVKPKMIKRRALQTEMHSLKEKEANEAKAKRMCQAKAEEHHLDMEILDAEYQMDWKKLTFYYYAETYVNFNSLVTDLFKIYKTRIWMSAVNPASFVTPPSMLQTSIEQAEARAAALPVGFRNGTAGTAAEQQSFNAGNLPAWPYTVRTTIPDQVWPTDDTQYGASLWTNMAAQDQRQPYMYSPYMGNTGYDHQLAAPLSNRFVSDMERLSLNQGTTRR